ncbi:MAG: UDP-N-acetylmuramoyl-L-alanyl-D-glutamate--2,6-diaminopimelate ligase [Clostridia bacterium]|nr:UDP-N-acetylmuramoyl-L-alanyl-D-glutamate--2,6-diaminopimelate ligase [Clostridia bacterium]
MKLRDVLYGLKAVCTGIDEDVEITGITHDSRKVTNGMLFAALPGADSGIHGMTYLEKAMEKGAAAVLCDVDAPEGTPCIRVASAESAYSLAAANLEGRPAEKLKLVGVTGTNGKTTTTHLITEILSRIGKKCGLIGTNEILIDGASESSPNTTPEGPELHRYFRRMVEAGCEYCVMEVSSHSLALGRVAGLRFAVGAFTNLTQDHLNFHGTMDNYAAAKAELFKISDSSVINLDDEAAGIMYAAAEGRKLTYSTKKNSAGLVAKYIRLFPESVEFEALCDQGIKRMKLGIPGMFSVENALTSVGVCLELGMSLSEIAEGLAEAHGVCGRAEIVPVGRDYTVMIDYAHTPDSLENILKTVRASTKGRVITVFGCGGDRDRTKRPIMGGIAEDLSDICVVTSDNPRTEVPEKIVEDIVAGMKKDNREVIVDRKFAIARALEIAAADDLVLIAGKGHELYQEINGVKHHFDEREVIRDILGI